MLAEKKRVILVKLEAAYGVDVTPVAADAILCSGLNITPLEGSSVERDFIRPFFGSSGSIRVENFASVEFETEIAGSGAAAIAPRWGTLLKACNFTETALAAAVTGTAQVGGSQTTIKLAAGASAVDDFYTGMTVSITGGTGSGQKGEIVAYVGSTKLAAIANPWLIAPDATSLYSIGTNVAYTPNSNFGVTTNGTSASIYFNVDGVRHILLGARGTVSFDLSVKQIPKMKWKFTGILGTVTDSALPTADFTGWQTPVTISTSNTTDINLLGYTGANIQKLTIDIANTLVHRQLINFEGVLLTDRKPKGSVSLEAVTVAEKDWWTMAKTAATGRFCVRHGQTVGNTFAIVAPTVQLEDPKYSATDGVTMMDFGMQFIPNGAAGNDEIKIVSK